MLLSPFPAPLPALILFLGVAGCSNDVSNDPRLRGGYRLGQELRLRQPALMYSFRHAHHQMEGGYNLMASDSALAGDDGVRVRCRLHPGTVLRVTRIEQLGSLDTATIEARARIVSGSDAAGTELSLGGVSVRAGDQYPFPPAPDPDYLEQVGEPVSDTR